MRANEILSEELVDSSWIEELELDDEGVVMRLLSGREYLVQDMDEETYEEWIRATSKGKFFHSDVKFFYEIMRL